MILFSPLSSEDCGGWVLTVRRLKLRLTLGNWVVLNCLISLEQKGMAITAEAQNLCSVIPYLRDTHAFTLLPFLEKGLRTISERSVEI